MDILELPGRIERPHGAQHIDFKLERFADVYEEGNELLRLHWQEIAPYQDLFHLDPNTVFYKEADDKGVLRIVTARADGRLIGYVVMLVSPHVHYRQVLVATDDIHFLHPDYRKGGVGVKLFKATERFMKDLGVKMMVLRTKAAHDHGVLFERMGYNKQDIVYSKRLDK